MKYFWFACFILALVGNYWWFGTWLDERDRSYNSNIALSECIDTKSLRNVVIDCSNECEECAEVDLDFLEWCENLPINQPASDELIIEPFYIAPVPEPDPVCTRYEYYFSNEVCIEWN